jgi:hypothetical protein
MNEKMKQEIEEIKRICEEMRGSFLNGENCKDSEYEASGNVSKTRC